ncbi:hypothetical protein [Streptomyces sp. NPDC090445]|uniref:hypothetical protein n=1 Tax=Streptomyces sp. NPDC090445 TaxID=3365963 RepID=UPI00382FE4DE
MDESKGYLKSILSSINAVRTAGNGKPEDQVAGALSVVDQGVESVKDDHFRSQVALKECEIRIANSRKRLADLREKARVSVLAGDDAAASMYLRDMRDVQSRVAPYQDMLQELREASDRLGWQKEFLKRRSEELRQMQQEVRLRAALVNAQDKARETGKHLDQLVREFEEAAGHLQAYEAVAADADEDIARIRRDQRAENAWVEEQLRLLKKESAGPPESGRS